MSGKKKKSVVTTDSDDGDNVSEDEEDESSNDNSTSDESSEEDFDNTSVASAEDEIAIEEDDCDQEYEMILKDQSNWINQSTAAISKNISSSMPSMDEPVTIAIASGVAVLSLLFLFSKRS